MRVGPSTVTPVVAPVGLVSAAVPLWPVGCKLGTVALPLGPLTVTFPLPVLVPVAVVAFVVPVAPAPVANTFGENVNGWPINCDHVCCCSGVRTEFSCVANCCQVLFHAVISTLFRLLPAPRRNCCSCRRKSLESCRIRLSWSLVRFSC